MKIELEPSDVNRGDRYVTGNGDELLCISGHAGGVALVNMTEANLITGVVCDRAVAAKILNHCGAVPAWLQAARAEHAEALQDRFDDGSPH